MSVARKLRFIWHELYYSLGSDRAVAFGMKCKDATACEDLDQVPPGSLGAFRLALHLSFCEACRDYRKFSLALKKMARAHAKQRENSIDVEELNRSLLKIHARVGEDELRP